MSTINKKRNIKELITDFWVVGINELKENKVYLFLFACYLAIFEFVTGINDSDRSNCLVKNLTGYPCPTCGMTRAYKALLSFDIKDALYWHPLFWLVPLVAGVILLRKDPLIKKIADSKVFWIVVGTLAISVYIYRMTTIYPDPPMDPHTSIYKLLIDFIKGLFT